MNVIHFRQAPLLVNYPACVLKKLSQTPCFTTFSYTHNKLWRALQLSIDEYDSVLSERESVSLQGLSRGMYDEAEEKNHVEMERRRKIGLANKGNIPWNKGKKHRAETRELIKQRTIEALRDPKIRQRMSESPRVHSKQSKAKIGSALRRLWEERSKHKRLQEKCIVTWAAAISQAAKMGNHGQQKLEWDSYDKMKASIILDHLNWKSEKYKAKELAKLKSKKTAEAKAARKIRLAQERREKEKKARARESKKTIRKLEECKGYTSLSRLKLKASIPKINGSVQSWQNQPMASAEVTPANHVQAATEKWDLEFIKKERIRKGISLAEQIQAAKSRRLLETNQGSVVSPTPDLSPSEKQNI